jgi:hypothetical protein
MTRANFGVMTKKAPASKKKYATKERKIKKSNKR